MSPFSTTFETADYLFPLKGLTVLPSGSACFCVRTTQIARKILPGAGRRGGVAMGRGSTLPTTCHCSQIAASIFLEKGLGQKNRFSDAFLFQPEISNPGSIACPRKQNCRTQIDLEHHHLFSPKCGMFLTAFSWKDNKDSEGLKYLHCDAANRQNNPKFVSFPAFLAQLYFCASFD